MTRVAALIGTGMVARTHLLALRDAGGVTLGAVVARRADSAERFADMAQAETGTRPRVLPRCRSRCRRPRNRPRHSGHAARCADGADRAAGRGR